MNAGEHSSAQCACTVAFAATIARLLNAQSVNVQLFGVPDSGRSGVLVAASSLWGWNSDPDLANEMGFGDSWNNTANNLEWIAPAYQHGFLPLDESRLAPRTAGSLLRTLGDTTMRLSGGLSRGRITENERTSFLVSVLSTSNMSLDQLAREERQ